MGYTFKNFTTEVLTVNDLNAQFAKIENKLGNIKNSDISTDARITSSKLLDRYGTCYQSFILCNDTWGGNFVFQDSATEGSVTEARIYPMLPSKRAFLVGVSIDVRGYSAGTGNGRVWINLNGTVIATQDITATGTSYIRSGFGSAAFASPVASLAEGDYIGLKFGRTATGGTTSATSVCVTLAYKIELTS